MKWVMAIVLTSPIVLRDLTRAPYIAIKWRAKKVRFALTKLLISTQTPHEQRG